MKLNQPVTALKKIGTKTEQKLKLMDIYTVHDLIEHFPRDYEDRSVMTPIGELEPNGVYTIKAAIHNEPILSRGKNMIITKMTVEDDTGEVQLLWFNQSYLKNSFILGQVYIFSGAVSEKNGKMQMIGPEYEKFSENLLMAGRIIPIYPLTYKLTQKMMRSFIMDALNQIEEEIVEIFPVDFLLSHGLCERQYAIKNIHFPENKEAFFLARYRLVFEELFIMQYRMLALKNFNQSEKTGIHINEFNYEAIKFNYTLTGAQQRVINEMIDDFQSGKAMYRLIQGDVGSGKTAVSIIGAYLCVRSGYQAAIMAPTEVLALQHYDSFKNIFEKLGITIVLLSGSLKKSERKGILMDIENGEAQIIIGTHAIISDSVIFHNLGLAVTDEQHRFGVKQRAKLAQKGLSPHMLIMSATPIPRTLAMVLYGDLDISIIDEMPPGRKEIDTFAVNTSYRQRIFAFVEKEVGMGRQAYVICSSIEDTGNEELKNVLDYTEELQQQYLKNCRVSLVHGKMKSQEKQTVMNEFAAGEIQVLISTTVIEVGINNPNATVMIIENAERFGLSQLHQLRGRVGRGCHKSYCILISDAKGRISKERLKAMTQTNDGFELSELDLKIRGPGDFFGTRQHGLPEFKIANIYKDLDILSTVQKIVGEINDWEENWQNLQAFVESQKSFSVDY